MKLTLKQFTKIKNQVKSDLLGTGEDKYKATPKFSKYAFEWDYHKAYPPCTFRLFFWWENGEVHGKRTTSAFETSPLDYHECTMLDDDYLKKVFT